MKDLVGLTKQDVQKLVDCNILKGWNDNRIFNDVEGYMICFDTSEEQSTAFDIVFPSDENLYKALHKATASQNISELLSPNAYNDTLLITPLCIIEDRYNGIYSGAKYLAFNMTPFSVGELDVDAGDMSCQDFWEHDAKDYIIGKGDSPLEALINLNELIQ